MAKAKYIHKREVFRYARDVVSGKKIACPEIVQACQRFLDDYESKRYDFRPDDAEFIIGLIELTICHQQGEMLDGTPLRGEPFKLMDFHLFIVYNIFSFYIKGTKERRYNYRP